MTKLIRVESCAGCDKKQRSAWGWLCPRLEGNIGDKVINDYVEAKTMHPDCPLDSEEVLNMSIKKQRDIAVNILGKIASTTEDTCPPFRAMPNERMAELAKEALAEIISHERQGGK